MQEFKSLIVIGAPKAGTTTLARLLANHPEIHEGTKKEPRFFCDFAARRWTGPHSEDFDATLVRDLDEYLALFADAPDGSWWLDASTDYLADEGARARLTEWAKTHRTRLICVLRDPVERAVSQYRHTIRDLIETETLPRALALEPERIRAGWQPIFWHARRSRYHADVSAYIDIFGDDLLLIDFDELKDQTRLVNRIFGFLGLAAPDCTGPDAEPARATVVKNRSYSYRSVRLQRLLQNPTLRGAARVLAPESLRHRMRRSIERANRDRYEPGESDLQALYAMLADDINACLSDSRLPTRSWTLSRRLAMGAQASQATPHAVGLQSGRGGP